MGNRGFEVVSSYKNKDIQLPVRKTLRSAGYDLSAAEDYLILPQQVTLIATGLKAFMKDDEYLGLHIRSSFAIKNKLSLINAQGIIDADYYNNPDNEGHIMIAVYNQQGDAVSISKGTRIAQGIFYKYLLADNDNMTNSESRLGGFGSTGEK